MIDNFQIQPFYIEQYFDADEFGEALGGHVHVAGLRRGMGLRIAHRWTALVIHHHHARIAVSSSASTIHNTYDDDGCIVLLLCYT